ncbi:MAG: thioredoxin domain-containing protein [Chloroflexota bacterium]|nr:thioredoxin domain-containing protein [Dehalococcoidia bacterium]MDW8254103.1 thioredoxin domain-containing protein [Chloroflexota bacterium]
MANRLQFETSPYLLQHAHNPVDWYPWGEEALRRAREEDKPILLSIGYSACHWCHVMERESFENEEIAALMNELFINIKVDREERPDLDQIYMAAVQLMTGHGGWPMTVFLTPEGHPYYGGTYFPPEDRGGMPGFPRVLRAAAEAYRSRRGAVIESARRITEQLRQSQELGGPQRLLHPDILDRAVQQFALSFDPRAGGFGGAPKFPQPMILDVLLRVAARTGDARARAMVERTLRKMAEGGMYDQLGGGFHRYSTDDSWLVPHFEKMLYDNAQLARVYLAAYQFTGEPFYRRIAEETLDYVLREMTAPEGGFYSSQDADSEGEEGKFFLWTLDEVRALLGETDARIFSLVYGVTAEGNFEHASVLHVALPPADAARQLGLAEEEVEQALARGRRILFQAREQRVKPGRDEKVLTSWNGLMLRAFAEAAAVLERPEYRRAAEANAAFLLDAMRPNGRLLRTWKDGRAHILGYLEDYANLIDGLIALYELTFAPRWIEAADLLARDMIRLFWDETRDGFYDIAADQEQLILRPRDVFDNATPSGNSAAVDALARLALHTGNEEYERRATTVLRSFVLYLERAPSAFGRLLAALDFAVSEPLEIVLAGDLGSSEAHELLRRVRRPYLPNKIVAFADPARPTPLTAGKTPIDGRPAVYVCRHYVCQAPVTDPDALSALLAAGRR